MYINYILLVHKNPAQVKRLITKLNDDNVNFYIHVDKNVNIDFFKKQIIGQNIFFIPDNKREYGIWGDLGIVKGTIEALKLITKHNNNGFCVLLSGQDYPLMDRQKIKLFFTKNIGTIFMHIFPLPYKGFGKHGGLDRINFYKIQFSKNRQDFIQLVPFFNKSFFNKKNLLNFIKIFKISPLKAIKFLLTKRALPAKLKPYCGGQWWAMPTNTARDILSFLKDNPNYIKEHKYTLLPDEIFFQTIIKHLEKNNPNLKTELSITYVNWIRKNTSLPVTFTNTTYDQNELKEQSKIKLFARKFDIEIDEGILDWIDENLI
ncbi:Core-2/I-Branching enzyme [Flavobacterium aquidurense]|uniref:Peptide O-xylosyltransferase n=1 Tax=Flavobacterium frigidimaris TaxID=262320 RepID=A0ABX4BUF6_FLAFR|nr:beta-1,6-N-acetylglucosaminyltransferase [Flavobacterium frigidimaris]OXA81460.1 hypothetical protein B0A65_04170 [Flavobacterium frigidimaris]SDZ05042.1 Core-2/I-Branching enzyme [Flavobacterium aquidurense]